jgi:simple sugar transport system ATP-binding protein
MRELIGEFEIRAAGSQVPASSLSGGNQQKVVLARALESKPKVLVVENPTQGLDIRATADIHRRLRDAAADGAAVLVYSSDLDEVMALGQRVLVVHQGRVTEAPPGASREVVGELMLGVSSNG